MKFFFLFFILISNFIYSQNTELFRPFIKSVERNFLIKNSDKQDSCFFNYTLLRVDIDSNYAISSIEFADNAEEWQLDALNKVKGKFDTRSLEEFVKKNEIIGVKIFFPFIIRKDALICNSGLRYPILSNFFFRFKNEIISGNCLFEDPIEIIFY